MSGKGKSKQKAPITSDARVVITKRGLSPRVRFGLVVIVLAAIASVALALYILSSNDTDVDETKPLTTAEALEQSQDYKYRQDYDAAARIAEDRYNSTSDQEEQWFLALETGTVYETKKDYEQAIVWYKKAEAIHPEDRGALSGLARSYEALGDKTKAVEYYQKTIASIDTSVDGAENDVEYYQVALNRAMGMEN